MKAVLFLLSALCGVETALAADTLPPLDAAAVPRSVEALYAGFDPDHEPLEARVISEREQDGVVVRMVTFTVGAFKGRKSVMGGFYAFPKTRAERLPGVLQMHGGGQVAQAESVVAWARNGYAAFAMNWGGKRMAGQPEGEAGTDWGAVDATQTGHNSHYGSCAPDTKTLDAFESPRNNNWFLIVLAAKRAVSFLQQQPEVDGARIGAEGHSMGGKLTVMLAGCDPRIKAAAPSCGGVGEAPDALRARPGNAARPRNTSAAHAAAIDDVNYLRRVQCPIVYLGPQNDFNGLLDELFMNWRDMPSPRVAFAISKHLNHRHEQAASFVSALWFEQHLKGKLTLPETPGITAELSGIPRVTVTPQDAAVVRKVEVFYSQDPNGQFRFWRTANARREGERWTAECPVFSTELPLFFIANVHYEFPKLTLHGPPWNRAPGATFLLSTRMLTFESAAVKAGAPKLTDTAQRVIESDFAALNDWYQLEASNPDHHQLVTRKMKDPAWRGPDGATLAIDVRDLRGGALALSFEFNSYAQYGRDKASGEFVVERPIAASPDWQTVTVKLADLLPAKPGQPLPESWQTLCQFAIRAHILHGDATLGTGRFDTQRELRNLRWIGGTYPKTLLMAGSTTPLDAESYARQFESQIGNSLDAESKEQKNTKP